MADASFRLPEIARTLDIAGHEFEVMLGDAEALVVAQRMTERLKSIEPSALEPEAYIDLCKEMLATIDGILGTGAAASVFAGRGTNIIDLTALLAFLVRQLSIGATGSLESVLTDLTETVAED